MVDNGRYLYCGPSECASILFSYPPISWHKDDDHDNNNNNNNKKDKNKDKNKDKDRIRTGTTRNKQKLGPIPSLWFTLPRNNGIALAPLVVRVGHRIYYDSTIHMILYEYYIFNIFYIKNVFLANICYIQIIFHISYIYI